MDGLLIDDWPAPAEPSLWLPIEGACTKDLLPQQLRPAAWHPVPCDTPHIAEVVAVSGFTGPVGAQPRPPDPASRGYAVALAECVPLARDFLGGDPYAREVLIYVAVPSPPQWTRGARWFACVAYEYATHGQATIARSRASSLRGALASDRSPGDLPFGVGSARATNRRVA